MSLEELVSKARLVKNHVLEQIHPSGFISASPIYFWYSPEWYRDASIIGKYLYESMPMFEEWEREEIRKKVEKIVEGLWRATYNFRNSIAQGLVIPLDSDEFKKLKYHVPARFDNNFYYSEFDKQELERNSWLRQYDALPWMLILTDEISNGEEGIPKVAAELLQPIVDYLSKFYITPSSSAWEIDNHMLHSYTIASIYAGLNAAKSLANKLGIQVKASDRAFYHGGVEGFLKDFFIRENVVWRGKLEFASDPVKELEASEIFIFSTFKPPLRNENTEAKSVSALEKELFRLQCGKEHIIPVRYVGDNYFGGGPWPLLGLEFARYWIINDKNKEKAVKIIEHVANMVSEDWPAVPEQEIVDKSCLAPDPMNYMEYNGGKPIMDLNWASSAFVAAVATLYKHKK